MNSYALFVSGENGYTAFRIPSLITLPGGRVIAFCEARVDDFHDWGEIHIVYKYSDDGGRHFSDLQIAVKMPGQTLSNPCPVFDIQSGVLHMLFNGGDAERGEHLILQGKGTKTAWHIQSVDNGQSWSSPHNISKEAILPGWTWHSFGPCHGLQSHSGRLLFPLNHAVLMTNESKSGPYITNVLYSDDHGKSWQLSKDIAENCNECALAELADGQIYINMRSYAGEHCRSVAYSHDDGTSWQDYRLDKALHDPICQGSVLYCDKLFGKQNVLLCSHIHHPEERENLCIHMSLDKGNTWKHYLCIHKGASAYSDMSLLDENTLLCLYECGDAHPYEKICLARIDSDTPWDDI